jgi:hypothetical protein
MFRNLWSLGQLFEYTSITNIDVNMENLESHFSYNLLMGSVVSQMPLLLTVRLESKLNSVAVVHKGTIPT